MTDQQLAQLSSRTQSSWARILLALIPAAAYAVSAAYLFPTEVNISEATSTEKSVIRFAGGLLLYLAIFLVVLLLCNGARKLVSREKGSSLTTWVVASVGTVALFLFGMVGTWHAQSHSRQNDKSLLNDSQSPITTAMASQTSHGVSDADLDLGQLSRIEDWIVTTTIEKAKLSNDPAFNATTYRRQLAPTSTYVAFDGKKLAITKMRPPGTRIVFITGIRGDELIRVVCARDSEDEIPMVAGDCGAAIEHAFQIKLSR